MLQMKRWASLPETARGGIPVLVRAADPARLFAESSFAIDAIGRPALVALGPSKCASRVGGVGTARQVDTLSLRAKL